MDLDSAKYVAITTRRRNGETVSSPVWIARLGDGRYGFTTDAASGKVKRIRNFPDVELQVSDVRGRVRPGSSAHLATARIVEGNDCLEVRDAIKKKYGWQFGLIDLMGSIKAKLGKSKAADCGVILTIQH